ncbi:MATE family efflux transporter [Isosphaeraceae bacterium EP7]
MPLKEQPIGWRIFRLAGPVLVEQVSLYFVGLSDTVLTGRMFSESHLAAVTVSSYLIWVVSAVMSIVSVGATALVARMVGGGDWSGANSIARQAVGMSLIVGLMVLIVGIGGSTTVIDAMNLEGETAERAALFLRIVLLSAPLIACTSAGLACLRGAGDTRTGMWVMVLVDVLNIGLSWGLIGGFGPLPALGFAGIAAGTAISESIGGLIILAVLAAGRSGLSLTTSGMIPRLESTRRLLRISLPAAGESLTSVGCQLWFVGLINRLGPTATAAHGVAIRCEAMAFLTISAFAVAASTLTGQSLGAGRPDLAARAVRLSWFAGVTTLSAMGVFLYWQAPNLFDLFLGGRQSEVTREGVTVLRIVVFAMPALATLNVLNGALRGAGDTRWPWLVVILGCLFVRIPLTYLFTLPESSGGMGLGLAGAWYAMLLDLWVRSAIVTARFLQGGWKRVRV